ncbi:protein of unknown function [Legionella pneumophila subsp. pneumophila]|nr:protein of unknown function [Legionella pneumophila subsp. pneumophila]
MLSPLLRSLCSFVYHSIFIILSNFHNSKKALEFTILNILLRDQMSKIIEHMNFPWDIKSVVTNIMNAWMVLVTPTDAKGMKSPW